ncbi:hypothetical protein Bca4012_054416 [Brassica carinata]
MISVVIIAELLVEYTAALAKLTAGILPRRQGDSNVVRVGGFILPCPSPSSTNRSHINKFNTQSRELTRLLDHSTPGNLHSSTSRIMISVVIIAELLVEYTTALAKLTAGILPRRQGDGNFIRIGNFSMYCPPRSSSVPDFSSHLVDF